ICRLLADIPHRIKSAIGITPCPPVKIPFDEKGWELFSKAANDQNSRQEVFRISTSNRLTATWYAKITEESMRASAPKAFSDYLDSWVNYECYEEIKGCSVPLKIIAGEHDPHLTYDLMTGTFGQWFANAKITLLKNCGHYPMYETPLSLAAECESFLRKFSD
ncbi:MAG: alpha/beta hydrolase, partial [Desulfobacteraceae bacterium]